jgi:hypothetical protein
VGLLIGVLLTIAAMCCIFLAAFIRLWRNPPIMTIYVNAPLNVPPLTVTVPDHVSVQYQHIPSDYETRKPDEEPIPVDILEYIGEESDTWAQDARRKRARMLKAETGSWDAAFRLLQREDNPE